MTFILIHYCNALSQRINIAEGLYLPIFLFNQNNYSHVLVIYYIVSRPLNRTDFVKVIYSRKHNTIWKWIKLLMIPCDYHGHKLEWYLVNHELLQAFISVIFKILKKLHPWWNNSIDVVCWCQTKTKPVRHSPLNWNQKNKPQREDNHIIYLSKLLWQMNLHSSGLKVNSGCPTMPKTDSNTELKNHIWRLFGCYTQMVLHRQINC